MRSCREITALVSKALDKTLSFRESLAVRLHLMMCSRCRDFQTQARFIHKAAHRYTEHLQSRLGNKS